MERVRKRVKREHKNVEDKAIFRLAKKDYTIKNDVDMNRLAERKDGKSVMKSGEGGEFGKKNKESKGDKEQKIKPDNSINKRENIIDKRLWGLKNSGRELITDYNGPLFDDLFGKKSSFKLSNLFLKQRIDSIPITELEEKVDEERIQNFSQGDGQKNSDNSQMYAKSSSRYDLGRSTYNSGNKAYSPIERNDQDNSNFSGSLKMGAGYEKNERIEEDDMERGFYNPSTESVHDFEEIRSSSFGSNLESAATDEKKSKRFKPKFY